MLRGGGGGGGSFVILATIAAVTDGTFSDKVSI